MPKYSVKKYLNFIKQIGLDDAWDFYISKLKKIGIAKFNTKYFNFNDFGKFYEIGLAYTNKIAKKNLGKYYTPNDVSKLMVDFLLNERSFNSIADTGCGCGNLIITLLNETKKLNPILFNKIIKNIHIYDLDDIALRICEARIKALFGTACKVHLHQGDFLSKKVKLPKNCAVIANPPYSMSKSAINTQNYLPCYFQAKDLYAGFIEKITNYCSCAVILTPQSFLVGNKFSLLRKKIANSFAGEAYCFDNVPGSIFDGKKEGIFNTNTGNSVRAAITVLRKSKKPGLRLTHLIRFKNTERTLILNTKYLKNQLGSNIQNLQQPLKCFKELEPFVNRIIHSNVPITISSLISSKNNQYKICVSTSARYFTLGSKTNLKRNGCYYVYADGNRSFYLLYALLNSSYCYLFWRMLDGGILYPKSVLLKTPLPTIKVSKQLKRLVDLMISKEKNYLVYKKNAGKNQESIKFPVSYRNKLNKLLFGNINFDILHQNKEVN